MVYDSRGYRAIIETQSNILVTGCMNTKIPEDVTAIEIMHLPGVWLGKFHYTGRRDKHWEECFCCYVNLEVLLYRRSNQYFTGLLEVAVV